MQVSVLEQERSRSQSLDTGGLLDSENFQSIVGSKEYSKVHVRTLMPTYPDRKVAGQAQIFQKMQNSPGRNGMPKQRSAFKRSKRGSQGRDASPTISELEIASKVLLDRSLQI